MRRTQEQRRQATQAAVLSAALDVLIADGYANFSASRVAARAGVSRGALERYFPTKNALLVAATQHAMDAAVAHAERLASGGGQRTVEQFLIDSEHFFFGPLYRAMLELAIAAASDTALAKPHRPIVARARKSLNRIWLEKSQRGGLSAQKRGAIHPADTLPAARAVRGRHLASLRNQPACGDRDVVGAGACNSRRAPVAAAVACARRRAGAQFSRPRAHAAKACAPSVRRTDRAKKHRCFFV